ALARFGPDKQRRVAHCLCIEEDFVRASDYRINDLGTAGGDTKDALWTIHDGAAAKRKQHLHRLRRHSFDSLRRRTTEQQQSEHDGPWNARPVWTDLASLFNVLSHLPSRGAAVSTVFWLPRMIMTCSGAG